MRRLRISAISYLNTAPLVWDFRDGHPEFDISYTVPSQCAAQLAQGSADVGIIPAFAYAAIPGLNIIPGVAIASKQRVGSILLISKCPLENIATVALDSSSLTSVALLKILFAKWWKRDDVTFKTADPDLAKMLAGNDAALVIGDPALTVDRSEYVTYDLAEEWTRFTGEPFVFAFWAIREAALSDVSPLLDVSTTFQRSRDRGLATSSIDLIARQWSHRLRLSEETLKSYLTENIHYSLDAACLNGLALFYKYAAECRLLTANTPLRFLEAGKLAFI